MEARAESPEGRPAEFGARRTFRHGLPSIGGSYFVNHMSRLSVDTTINPSILRAHDLEIHTTQII